MYIYIYMYIYICIYIYIYIYMKNEIYEELHFDVDLVAMFKHMYINDTGCSCQYIWCPLLSILYIKLMV